MLIKIEKKSGKRLNTRGNTKYYTKVIFRDRNICTIEMSAFIHMPYENKMSGDSPQNIMCD